MWLFDIMMVQFSSAIACLFLDSQRKWLGEARAYIVGFICTGAFIFSVVDLLWNWNSSGSSEIRPLNSPLASLYSIDSLTEFVILAVLIIATAVSVYSWKFLSFKDRVGSFFSMLLLLLASIVGVIAAGDLITLFLFWEAMSITAYGLVAFYKEQDICLEAALKYLLLAGTGTLLALFGMAIVYSVAGSIEIVDLWQPLALDPQLGAFGIMLLILGFGVEAAIFPLHTWLPDAYSAASIPVSAALSGAVTGTAVFVLVKVVRPLISEGAGLILSTKTASSAVFSSSSKSIQLLLIVLAVLTMLIGNLSALAQPNMKRILAFSSIAQVGYMLAALSTFTVSAIVAIVFQIWNQGIVKSSFFLASGLAGRNYSDLDLETVRGFGQQNKVSGFIFVASSLGMVGSPPFGMFWSELLIVQVILSVANTTFYVLAAVVLLNVVLSIGYYFRVISTTTLSPPPKGSNRISVSWQLLGPVAFLLLLSLVTGIVPSLFLKAIS